MVANTAVNLRRGPSISSSIIKVVKKGELLTYIASTNGWAEVALSDNVTGYIDPNYLDLINDNINNESNKKVTDQIKKTEDPLDITVIINSVKELTKPINVFKEPVDSSIIISQISANNKIYLIDKITNESGTVMIKIRTLGGNIIGYIKENDL
tara:strand:- start:131 stop:592 length:462 start_codon:yes stop_codon:yes gene_type:complete